MRPLPQLVPSGLIGLSSAFAESKPETAQASAKAGAITPVAAKLTTGSPAPAFKPAKWLKGEPVAAFEKDKTYLIECWATWCGPRLAGARDYPLALTCIDRLIADDPNTAKSPDVVIFRARALDAVGRTAEATEALVEITATAGSKPEHAANAALTALKAGKPWPRDRVNPDGK